MSRFPILTRIGAKLFDHARTWRALLHSSGELKLFFGVNVVLSVIQIERSIAREGWPSWLFVPAVVLGLPTMYLAVFVVLHFIGETATEEGRPTPPLRHARRELVVVGVVALGFVALSTWLLRLGHAGVPIARELTVLSHQVKEWHVAAFRSLGLPLPPGVESFYVLMVAPLVALAGLRTPLSSLGFRRPAANPLCLCACVALFVLALLLAASQFGVLAWFACLAAFLGAGLPEEFFFRALLQTRLEALSGRPLRALVLSSLAFGALHLLRFEDDLVWQLADAFGFKALLGFVFGYLYWRTRSVWPGALFHAAIDVTPFAQRLTQ